MDQFALISLGDVAIAAVALVFGIYELWLFSRRRREFEHLWVALVSFSAAIYAALMFLHYNLGREHAVLLIKLELIPLLALMIWLPLIAFESVGRKQPLLLALCLAGVALALALLPTDIIISNELKDHRLLLLDRPFPRYVGTPGVVALLIYALVVASMIVVWFHRNRPKGDSRARASTIAAFAWVGLGAVDGIFGMFQIPVPMNLFEYGYTVTAAMLVWGHVSKHMEMLDANERDFLAVIDQATDAVVALQDDRVVYANAAFSAAMEGLDAKGLPIVEIVHKDDLDLLRQLRSDPGLQQPTIIRVVRRDGSHVQLEVAVVAVEMEGNRADVLMARDVTARKQLTARLMEMDRLVSVGTLAAAVGHEINNPLSYVTLNLEEMHRQIEDAPALAKPLQACIDGVERIRETVETLRFFSKSQDAEGTIWLDQVIRSAVAMAGNEIQHRALIDLDLEPNIPVFGNETRLGQVFVNLLINAAHAIPEGNQSGNCIHVSCRRVGDIARFEINDTGTGIEPERMEQIFDAFYTTKDPEVGLGLGLGISRETIRSMGGDLDLSSSLRQGTTLRGELPMVEPTADPEPAIEDELVPLRRAKVLLVDDEPLVLKTLCRTLSREADTKGVESLAEALAAIVEDSEYDLILTDVMMPNGSGIDLYRKLQDDYPALAQRVVFMSGGIFTADAQTFREQTDRPFIAKPPDMVKLRQMLQRAVKR